MTMNSESLIPQPAFQLGRRGLLQKLGLVGLGSLMAQAAMAQPATARPARASPARSLRIRQPSTTILAASDRRVLLRTGPLTAFPAARGARLGVCLLAPTPLIRSIAAARVDHDGLGAFLADPRVERGVHRLLGALDIAEPVELYGLSAHVASDISAGDGLEITWEATLRHGSVEDLGAELERYHACVLGELSPESTFTAHLNYVEVSRT